MIKKTEILLLGKNDEDILIDEVEGLLNLQVNDKFYFSFKGSSPRSELEYIRKNNTGEVQFPSHVINGVIDDINKKSKEYWIKDYVVVKITKGYVKDHSYSISDPKITYTECIFVMEKE